MNRKSVLLILVSTLLVTRVFGLVSYMDVTVQEAKTMIESNPALVVLDVRTQSEYEEGHIRNAKLIPHTELDTKLNELNMSDEILVYCRTGVRSSIASQILIDNGFLHVYNMLEGITGWINEGYPTFVKYSSIQEAINNAAEGDTIFVSSGTYIENVVLNKSISLIGEDKRTTVINGNNSGIVVLIITDDAIVKDFQVEKGDSGISVIDSNNCTISNNVAKDNRLRGILISQSWNVTIRHNLAEGAQPGYGINLNASKNVIVEQNTVANNYFDGIGLLSSNNSIVIGNTVINNTLFGIWVDSSNHNTIYNNNIIENGIQATSNSFPNTWDSGVEGNFWSNYSGADSNYDGIGDSPYIIDLNNTDNYPLVGRFSSFTTSLEENVNVISNSTIEDFEYFEPNTTIRMHVSNMTENQTFGFCRVRIPHTLMNASNISVVIDSGSSPVQYHNYSLYDNGTHRWIYFSYAHSALELSIIPEFPSLLILSLFMLATPLVVIILRRKRALLKKQIRRFI